MKPHLKKGPAAAYAGMREIIREFSVPNGPGGLISLWVDQDDEGKRTLSVHLYQLDPAVTVTTSYREDGQVPSEHKPVAISTSWPARKKAVKRVLSQEDSADGRSDWRWFILPNGDMILGVYPRGETYEWCEGAADDDHIRADSAGTVQVTTMRYNEWEEGQR